MGLQINTQQRGIKRAAPPGTRRFFYHQPPKRKIVVELINKANVRAAPRRTIAPPPGPVLSRARPVRGACLTGKDASHTYPVARPRTRARASPSTNVTRIPARYGGPLATPRATREVDRIFLAAKRSSSLPYPGPILIPQAACATRTPSTVLTRAGHPLVVHREGGRGRTSCSGTPARTYSLQRNTVALPRLHRTRTFA